VGAGTAAKQWPLEHWQQLIARLVRDYAAQVVLVGSPADGIIARAILDREFGLVADWTGQLRLAELAALVEQCDLFLGADSGPAHLAAAVGARVAVLFSGTNDPRQWQPCGERVRLVRQAVACQPCHRQACRWANHPCMRGLRPDRVMAAIEPWLAETPLHFETCSPGVRS
jgi:ADP-heptose:LPS heptosyltransferase